MPQLYEVDLERCRDLAWSSRCEWMLADGTGGFAMGTVAGLNTRRYHGHLVAAISPPAERMVLLDSLEAFAEIGSKTFGLSTNQYPGTVHPEGFALLDQFICDDTRVEWRYDLDGVALSKSMGFDDGGLLLRYANLSKRTVRLILKPLVCHKPYHGNFAARQDYPREFKLLEGALEVIESDVTLRLEFPGAHCQPVEGWYYRFEHQREIERGLDPRDDLYCPCELTIELKPDSEFALSASAGQPLHPRSGDGSALERAVERFLVTSPGRESIIAGYPWFTDWGRDTMISLPGVCLARGQVQAARQILRDYAGQMHQGLIPNRFTESGSMPDYNTVDASLWFVNAIYRTLAAEWDDGFALEMAGHVEAIVDWHRAGTMYGIRIDAADGLLTQGVDGSQLTWMDAKIGDWVITPRRGKPVEINGLWINALRIQAWLKERLEQDPTEAGRAADLAEASFHQKFWSEHHGWYFDTIDPLDAQLRPNQLISMSLPFGPLDPEHAELALTVCEEHLVTPRGMRTLAPFEIHYHGRFEGPLPDLDAAYHQGTVWPWLLGIYWQVCQRVRGTAPIDMNLVNEMLAEFGLGGIAECYDGDAPHRPGGCPWQAWSVATILDAVRSQDGER